MNKCVLITCVGDLAHEALQQFLQKKARDGNLEGMVYTEGKGCIKIATCGVKHIIDQFVDELYDHSVKLGISEIEVEPFFKNKDFRGVFRILQ